MLPGKLVLTFVALTASSAASFVVGTWWGRAALPTPPPDAEAAGSVPPAGLPGLVDQLAATRADQDLHARAVLARLEHLSRDPARLSADDRKAVFRAYRLFGDLRYAPAADFLAQQVAAVEHKLDFVNPTPRPLAQSIEQLRVSAPDRAEDMWPDRVALAEIGPPAAGPLVREYVRAWKLKDPQLWRHFESTLYNILSSDQVSGAALIEVQKRLGHAGLVETDQAELDALQHLKQMLLERLD